MLLHTRIQNVGLVGVETRRTLPLSACRTMCQLQGCNCTPGSQALGLWASIRGEPFLCLHDETCGGGKKSRLRLWGKKNLSPVTIFFPKLNPVTKKKFCDQGTKSCDQEKNLVTKERIPVTKKKNLVTKKMSKVDFPKM